MTPVLVPIIDLWTGPIRHQDGDRREVGGQSEPQEHPHGGADGKLVLNEKCWMPCRTDGAPQLTAEEALVFCLLRLAASELAVIFP